MNDDAGGYSTKDIIVEEVYPHAPEAIWRTLTTPALMARWLMKPEGFEPIKGNRFTYQTTPKGAWNGVIHCEILEIAVNERLVYSWKGGDDGNLGYGSRLETVVTLALEKIADGTRLRLVHSGFRIPDNSSAYDGMSGGWLTVMTAVGSIANDPQG